MMKIKNLDDVLTDELKDIYSAEQQLIRALPKMAKAADGELRNAFENHLVQTRIQSDRIQAICDQLNISPKGKKCAGMAGLIKEGEEVLASDSSPDSLKAALIGAAQRVEHYEIAAYGTARTHARQLGYISTVNLLEQTLEEEKETDQKLTSLAENNVNVKAAMEGPDSQMGQHAQM
jgi:ferritin-like metal-binding protein YciE